MRINYFFFENTTAPVSVGYTLIDIDSQNCQPDFIGHRSMTSGTIYKVSYCLCFCFSD